MLSNKITLLIVGIALLLINANLQAQPIQSGFITRPVVPNLFQVELVVFEHLTPSAEKQAWPAQVNLPSAKDAIELKTLAANGIAPQLYQLLPSQYFKLNHEANLLAKQSDYKIILHIAWLQPLTAPNEAKPIHIYGGQSLDNQGGTLWQINGLIKLSRDDFINLKTNLILSESNNNLPSDLINDSNATVQMYELKELRRLKPNELNYLDHPLFGVLIKIIPLGGVSQQRSL